MILRVTLLEPETDLSVRVCVVHILIVVISVYEDAGIEAHVCLRPSVTLT